MVCTASEESLNVGSFVFIHVSHRCLFATNSKFTLSYISDKLANTDTQRVCITLCMHSGQSLNSGLTWDPGSLCSFPPLLSGQCYVHKVSKTTSHLQSAFELHNITPDDESQIAAAVSKSIFYSKMLKVILPLVNGSGSEKSRSGSRCLFLQKVLALHWTLSSRASQLWASDSRSCPSYCSHDLPKSFACINPSHAKYMTQV